MSPHSKLGKRSGIKPLAQQHIQIVNRQREFTKSLGGFFVQVTAFQLPLNAPEAFAQRERFIGIPELLKQALDLFYASQSGTNDANGSIRFGLPGFHTSLTKKAFELAAIVAGAIGINVALAAGERGAGLQEFTLYDLRFTI